jgi:hypothetical protein
MRNRYGVATDLRSSDARKISLEQERPDAVAIAFRAIGGVAVNATVRIRVPASDRLALPVRMGNLTFFGAGWMGP